MPPLTFLISCLLLVCQLSRSDGNQRSSSLITITVQYDEVSSLKCLYKAVEYEEGAEFRDGVCRKCRCEGGVVVCQETICPRIQSCEAAFIPEGKCCPVCSERRNVTFSQVEFCSHGNQLHRVGASWQQGDCTLCRCETGGVSRCEVVECSQTQPCWEVDTERSRGQCCPVCKVKGCLTPTGLKREGDVWRHKGEVAACKHHQVESVNCNLTCSNDTNSLECQECNSANSAIVTHECGQKNATFHRSGECVSVRSLYLVTNNCPIECRGSDKKLHCCQPVIKQKSVRHLCARKERQMLEVSVVTKCRCAICQN